MGDLMRSLGSGDEARQFFQKALDIREQLVRQEPGRADYLRDLSVSFERMGDLMSSLGSGDEARQFFHKALDIREQLVRQEPGRADYLLALSIAFSRLGGLTNDHEARELYQKALGVAEGLVRDHPEFPIHHRQKAFLVQQLERLGSEDTTISVQSTPTPPGKPSSPHPPGD
jgi:tetratricopeptide (TPR) repeat protein